MTTRNKPPKPRKLLKRPLADPAELELLSAWVAERQAKLRERGRVVLVMAAILIAISGVVIFSQPAPPGSDRFILPAMLIFAAAIATPSIVRRWWTHPRVLAAQRRLLFDRGAAGSGLEDPEAVLVDLERRIAKAEALLTRDTAAPDP